MAEPSDESPSTVSRWATFKDRLAIVSVVVALLLLLFLMIDGSIENYQCTFTEFISFKCNRWNARFTPWDQLKHRPE